MLLEHPPGGAHLVVASRRDPPLPLARMRARHQLVEIRMGELRFDEPVTAAFLDSAVGGSAYGLAVGGLAEDALLPLMAIPWVSDSCCYRSGGSSGIVSSSFDEFAQDRRRLHGSWAWVF